MFTRTRIDFQLYVCILPQLLAFLSDSMPFEPHSIQQILSGNLCIDAVKVKDSRKRPGGAQTVPGYLGS